MLNKKFFILIVLIVLNSYQILTQLVSDKYDVEAFDSWKKFAKQFNVNVKTNETEGRFHIYKNNYFHVKNHNQNQMSDDGAEGVLSYKMKLYNFSYLSFKEFEERYLGAKMTIEQNGNNDNDAQTEASTDDDAAESSEDSTTTETETALEAEESASTKPICVNSTTTTTTTRRAPATTTTPRSIITTLTSSSTTTSTTTKRNMPINNTIPDSWDWRKYNAVTPVKNQLQCGSCWAFSVTGALEGQYAIKRKVLKSFSEQQLVDCTKHINSGCNGGWPASTYSYVTQNGIIDEATYPYTATDNRNCAYLRSAAYKDFSGSVKLPQGDEQALKRALYLIGPLSVIVSVENSFMWYSSGIFNTKCLSQAGNHAVLLVGYGTENGKDFWIVKNSWGTRWGENGYIRMARNANNLCLIASWATYPLIK